MGLRLFANLWLLDQYLSNTLRRFLRLDRRLGNRFNIGFDLRWSDAEVDLDFGPGFVLQDVAVGGLHGGLTLGFGW